MGGRGGREMGGGEIGEGRGRGKGGEWERERDGCQGKGERGEGDGWAAGETEGGMGGRGGGE